eukprot:m.164869 g.164869  ORF g.164869 m.164869 type:complete len:68 (+) comp53106_c0_seq42:202-405(+)
MLLFQHVSLSLRPDTAMIYRNEEAIGAELRDQFAAGLVKREDVFVATKLGIVHVLPGLDRPARAADA